MKSLFDGMKRAKVRTILSVLIAFVMTASIAVCSYMTSSPMMHGRNNNAPDMKMSQSVDDNTADAQASPTEEGNDSEASTDNAPAIPNDRGKGQGSSLNIVIASAILVIGIVLLFAVNLISTKKRNNEFKQILSNGVPIKAIKKQLFMEAFIIVLIAGIVGGGVGVAIAQPVSSTVMSQRMTKGNENENMPEGFTGEMPQGDFDPDNKPENMPEDFNSDNKPEMPQDKDNIQEGDGSSTPQGDFKGDRQGNTSAIYISAAIIATASAVICAIISGVACCLPVKKINFKEIVNE